MRLLSAEYYNSTYFHWEGTMTKLSRTIISVMIFIIMGQLTPTVASAGKQLHFIDEFDGSSLKKSWEVINPNDDHMIVEDDALLVLSTKPGTIKVENIENLLRLTKPMPEGDWIITAKFTIEYQTFREHLRIGIYDDNDNWIIAENYLTKDGYGNGIIHTRARKSAKAEEKSFDQHLAGGKGRNFAESYSKPQYLQLRKQGRKYLVSAKFEDQENWMELQKLTSLHGKGNLVIGFSQYAQVSGESFVKIDSVKIEIPTPELTEKSEEKPKVPR